MENMPVTNKSSDCRELSPVTDCITLPQFIQSQEREILLNALENTKWNCTKAAKYLGITFRAARYLVAKAGLIAKLHGDRLREYPLKYSSIYESKFKTLRYEILLRDNSTCQLCGSSPNSGAIMHVDHIKPRSKYPELELDKENLRVLCSVCNLSKSDRTDHIL